MISAFIEAIEFELPKNVVTNEDLAREFPAWDMARMAETTGVRERHIAEPHETALDLGYRACLRLKKYDLFDPTDLDALVFCTETPDFSLPPNSCLLQSHLGLSDAVMAFDITLACSGFVYALGIARSLLVSGMANKILVVTADTYSRLIHPGDRSSRCLFGDGGAATVVGTGPKGWSVLDMTFGTSGKQHDRFIVRAGGARLPRSDETAREVTDRSGNIRTAEHIAMDGLGVLSFFSSVIPGAIAKLLTRNGLSTEDVDLFVFHQASKVTLEGIARSMGLSPDRCVLDMATTGNLVSASIPTALSRAEKAGRIHRDGCVVLCGFGVGLSWATALLRT
jgi:3-oxoacyl-[acyl-carrier-protein] synthase III